MWKLIKEWWYGHPYITAIKGLPPGIAKKTKRSNTWSYVRNRQIKKFPTCAACGGKKNLQVHHIKPFHLFPELELAEDNLLTLCESNGRDCHLRIGHGYDFRAYVETVVEDAAYSLGRIGSRKYESSI